MDKILVAHLGARRHYAEIKMLGAHGRLEHFYTDLCAAAGPARWISRFPQALQPAGLRRLLGRRPPVPAGLVTHFPSLGLRYFYLRRAARSSRDLLRAHLWAGSDFCRRILSRGLGEAGGVYTFNSAGLELLREARRRGLSGFTDQTIAPLKTERLLLSVEQQKWPGWEAAEALADEWNRSVEREESEWAEAGTILCGSAFVADAVAAAGGPREKCRVVQFGLSSAPAPQPRTDSAGSPRPLRVLTVGAVGLRKGSPYVLQAARRLKGLAEFRLVGGLGGLLPAALARLSRETQLLGPAPRSAMAGHYAWADVFFLPSVCEGSAMACFEALAAGLPVVTTPNAGSVVQDGIEGFIVPAGETGQFCEKIARLADNPRLRARLSRAALKRSDQFSLEKRSRGFLEALGLRP